MGSEGEKPIKLAKSKHFHCLEEAISYHAENFSKAVLPDPPFADVQDHGFHHAG